MKYIYQIIQVPWHNSTLDVWQEGSPETKTRLVVMNFITQKGHDQQKLVEILKLRFQQEAVEVEEFTP